MSSQEYQPKYQRQVQLFLVFFLILQPLLDLNIFFLNPNLIFFGLTIPSLVRMGIVGALCLFEIIQFMRRPKDQRHLSKKWLFLALAYVLYLVIHHFVASNYYAPFVSQFPYSLKSDAIYFFKSLIPIVLIFLFMKYRVKDYFKEIIYGWILLIAGSIVLTNLLGISLSSYTNEPIVGNIFTWFTGIYNEWSFLQVASKGFFRYANEISAILAILTPFITYYAFVERKVLPVILLFVTQLSMLMIGTKVALYSFMMMFAATVILIIFYDILLGRQKIKLYQVLLLVVFPVTYVAIFPYSPSIARSTSMSTVAKVADEKEMEEEPDEKLTVEDESNLKRLQEPSVPVTDASQIDALYDTIEKKYPEKRISHYFLLKAYPYNVDPDFWVAILKQKNEKTMNNRFVELQILKRVKAVNDQPLESFFGMGYSRMNQLYPLEQDFIAHFYTIGIVGILLFFGQYFLVFGIGLIILFRGKIFKLQAHEAITLMSLVYLVAVAINSGNVIDSLFTPIIAAALISKMLFDYRQIMTRKGEKSK